jgi:hypothetical protein
MALYDREPTAQDIWFSKIKACGGKVYAHKKIIEQYHLGNIRRRDEFLYREMLYAQHEIGTAILGELENLGGAATVALHKEWTVSPMTGNLEFILRAALVPATVEHIEQRICVPYQVYFPADWVCDKCGSIVNGLDSPRICTQCSAPRKTREWWNGKD